MNALSGDGDDEGGVMYDEYDNTNNNTMDYNNNNNTNEHPCMSYWDAFQNCMNMNGDEISACQNIYDAFRKCQRNPDGM